jgi:hypothetical protein
MEVPRLRMEVPLCSVDVLTGCTILAVYLPSLVILSTVRISMGSVWFAQPPHTPHTLPTTTHPHSHNSFPPQNHQHTSSAIIHSLLAHTSSKTHTRTAHHQTILSRKLLLSPRTTHDYTIHMTVEKKLHKLSTTVLLP